MMTKGKAVERLTNCFDVASTFQTCMRGAELLWKGLQLSSRMTTTARLGSVSCREGIGPQAKADHLRQQSHEQMGWMHIRCF